MAEEKVRVLDHKEIEQLLDRTTGGVCKVTLRNGVPASYNLTIVAAGTKFFFRDKTDYVDGPVKLNLKYGDEAHFDSNDSSKCVYQEQTFLTAVIPGQKPATFQAIGSVKPDECLLAITHILAPKKSAKAEDVRRGDLAALFELRVE